MSGGTDETFVRHPSSDNRVKCTPCPRSLFLTCVFYFTLFDIRAAN